VVLLYLAGSSASLLENTLVEKEQVTSAVYYSTDDRPKTEIRFTLTSVATEKLAEVEKRFFEVLQDAMEKEIDMKYLRECIQRHRRSWKFSTENSAIPFAEYAIFDFLFGEKDGSTLLHVATLREYEALTQWHENQWRGFIKQWISEAPHISILGVPSAKLAAKLKTEEESRVEARKTQLGEDGLRKLAEELDKAKAENDREIPRAELAKFKVPGIDSIHFISTITARSGSALEAGHLDNKIQQTVDSDGLDLPLFIHFEHIPSNFVQISVIISTQSVPTQLRPLLSVYTEAFFALPLIREGKTVDFEQVIIELERDTVGYHMDGGYSFANPETLVVSFQAELEKYQSAISWLKELTWGSVFDVERLKAITTRLLSDVPGEKRSGGSMLDAVQSMVQLAPDSIVRARSTLAKAQYLKRIKHLLARQPAFVVSCMEEIRKSLFRFENFRILVVADLEKLPKPVSTWTPFLEGMDTSVSLSPIVKLGERLSDAGKNPGKLAYVIPMPTIDSSFANSSAKGLDSYDHPQLPALMVAMAYMNAVEGPLWVAVRGTGLAYGTKLSYNVNTGLVHFWLYRSPNAHKAFDISKQTVEDFVSRAREFDGLMLEGAISSIVVSFANEQSTLTNAAQASFVRQVIRNLPGDYTEKILKKVRDVGVDEIREVLANTVLPLFTPGKSDIIVTCSPILEAV
jgi:Zn-dependent M16 (insulinase) family peptidase